MSGEKHKKRKKHEVFYRFFLLLLLLVFLLFYENQRIQVEEFTYASAHLPDAFDGYRIVQLSDLHGKSFGKGNQHLIDAVAVSKPDCIVLTGDFVDAQCTVSDIEALMHGLTTLAPVYYVTGNHEWAAGLAQEMLLSLRNWGITCLENQFVRIESGKDYILLAGIHDPNGYADQKTPEQLAKELYVTEKDPFWILLAHRNTLFDGRYCRLGADLTLSGHGHGGIWRLPLTDGVFGSHKQLFPSFTA